MSTVVSHFFPVNPAGQEQAKSSIKSVQLLPSKQGDLAQSSILSARSGPPHPAGQTHLKRPCFRGTHWAELEQGLAAQGSRVLLQWAPV